MRMKILMALGFCFVPQVVLAQVPETVDSCGSLRQEILASAEVAAGLDKLLEGDVADASVYLSQLYDGVKILSQSGEMFFKAADSHEPACKSKLLEAGKLQEVRAIYDWYLEPVKSASQFFHRARQAAVRFNRQGDVDAFNEIMVEYAASVMKLVGACESDLGGSALAPECATLSATLSDALKTH